MRNNNRKKGASKKREIFYLKSFSSLCEYLLHKPETVLEVRCKPSYEARVRDKVESSGLSSKILKVVENKSSGQEDESPVEFSVRLETKSEADLLKQVQGRSEDVILALDHITDPRNLGAIVRSAAFFGIKDVILPNRRQVLLTDIAVMTAKGGFALTEATVVVNLGRCLEQLKEQGYWVIGAAMDGENPEKLACEYSKCVIVLGNEEKGLSQSVTSKCDRFVGIPSGLSGGIDSLNVSVAAGICLYEFSSKRKNM